MTVGLGVLCVLGAAVGAAGCVPYDEPYGRRYPGPVYAAPTYQPGGAPAYSPYGGPPPPLGAPLVVEPVEAPPGRVEVPGPEVVEPRAEAPRLEEPAPEAPRVDGPAPGAPQDAVTDLLLTPLPQRDAAQPAPVRAPAAQDPFMGFRPMCGQARPTP